MNEIINELIPQAEQNYWQGLTLSNPATGLNESWNWNSFFNNHALQGLEETQYFNQNYPLNSINNSRFSLYDSAAKQMNTNCN